MPAVRSALAGPKGGVKPPMASPAELATAIRAQHLPDRYRSGDALDLDDAEFTVLEEIACQPSRARGDDDGVRLCEGLQTGGEGRRFADDRLFLRWTFADQIADDHQPLGDPDARLELDGFDIEVPDTSMALSPARTARPASSSCACG
jgi:hypothetical protein